MPADPTAGQTDPKHPHRPARNARRLRRVPAPWVRMAALALFVVALTVGMVGLTLKAVRPYREAGAESTRLQSTRRLAAAQEASNDALRRHIAYLKTSDGVAEEAHRLGYMRPGERPLVILGLGGPSAPGDAAPGEFSSGGGTAPPETSSRDHSNSLLGRFQSHQRDL